MGIRTEVVRSQLPHLVLDEIQPLLVQADFLADGSRAVWHIETLLSQYNGHFSQKLGSGVSRLCLAGGFLSLYNGQNFCKLGGSAKNFPSI